MEPQIAPIATLGKPVVLWNLLFLSLVCSLACYLLWAYAVLKIGAVTASNYLYFQPVVTMIFSFVILHETITAVGMTGCLMILLGVWLADYLQRRKIFAK